MPIKVMISSTVYYFEDQIDQIDALFKSMGYETIVSKSGSVFADPRYGNFPDCLHAVEECELSVQIAVLVKSETIVLPLKNSKKPER